MLPPQLFLILAAASCLIGWLFPVRHWIELPASLLGAVPLVAGLALSVAGSQAFDRVGTNIKTFDDPGVLVTEGLFSRTRNPMYLGLMVSLLGVAVLVGSATALLGPIGFLLVANWHYIPFEEQRMRQVFGSSYEQYARRVRRWI